MWNTVFNKFEVIQLLKQTISLQFFFKTVLIKKQILLGTFFDNLFRMIIFKSAFFRRTQPDITCSKQTIETTEQVVKYVQS